VSAGDLDGLRLAVVGYGQTAGIHSRLLRSEGHQLDWVIGRRADPTRKFAEAHQYRRHSTRLEDALADLEVFAGAAKSQDKAVADSDRALNIALNRYTGGLVTYLDVVTAQQSLLANQREAAQIQGGQLVSSVMLVKALGGGWDAHSLAGMPLKPNLKTVLAP